MAGGGVDSGQKPLRKAIITGFSVVAEMLTGGLFMENVKIEKQRTNMPYGGIMRNWLRQGLSGFWLGFWPWGFTLAMTKGSIVGFSRAFFLNTFENSGKMSQRAADISSGFCAGMVQGVFMSPILLARTRVNQSMTERATAEGGQKLKTGFMAEMSRSMKIMNVAIKEEGAGVIVKGMPTMVCKRAMDWGTRFIFMRMWREGFKSRKAPGEKLTDIERLISAFNGGAMSVCVTQPIDRMMPIIQQAGASGEGILTFTKRSIKEQGFSTMQRGACMRIIHCGWHTAFAIFASNKIYDALDKIM